VDGELMYEPVQVQACALASKIISRPAPTPLLSGPVFFTGSGSDPSTQTGPYSDPDST
jgi:hypothetical protein